MMEKEETGPAEQPLFVTPEDWDIAVMHGQYSQGVRLIGLLGGPVDEHGERR